jgi:ferrous iron transport protein A
MLRKWFIAFWPAGESPFAGTPTTQETHSWVDILLATLFTHLFQPPTARTRIDAAGGEPANVSIRHTQSLPLSSLSPGSIAMVTDIRLPRVHRPRLMEMGLLVGTRVQLVRFAPLGDPVEIKLRGYHLSLRKNDADQIWVSPHPAH